jgi:hypothetical protein
MLGKTYLLLPSLSKDWLLLFLYSLLRLAKLSYLLSDYFELSLTFLYESSTADESTYVSRGIIAGSS